MNSNNTENVLQKVGNAFKLPGNVCRVEEMQGGNINKTYKVTYQTENGREKSYLFQKVNTYVFKNPIEVMENIDHVTTHIRKKRSSGNSLHFHHTADGKNYYFEGADCFWRVRNFLESMIFNVCTDPEILAGAGRAFGEFQKDLRDFDVALLKETIPDFHNTRKRLETLFRDAEEDRLGRAAEVSAELDYIKSVSEKACTLIDMQQRGELPLRVAHNDTKINNVLFCMKTGAPLTVIDLDTVMPGLLAYDFGDAVRFGGSTAAEDEADLSKVSLSLEQFDAFASGFVPGLADTMTENEKSTLALGAFCITVELAARFLDDYITGDLYFKTLYTGHNLVRTKAQLALAKDMEKKMDQMEQIVSQYCS